MANAPQMKIPIGADTSDFDKGARKVKQEMKDLNKVSSDAFAAIGKALGVDVGKIEQFSSALSGLGRDLSKTGAEGSTAFTKIGGAITSAGAAIAGIGLAAAIAAFKQLNAEADAFELTVQGGVIKAQTDAFTSTFAQVLRDQSAAGNNVSSWRQDIKEIWAVMKGGLKTGFDTKRMEEATQLAGRAKDIATELYKLDLERKESNVRIAELDAEIAQKREIISDVTKSAAERSSALASAQQLIKEKLNLQLPLAERNRDLLVEYNGLAGDTMKEFEAEIAAKIEVNNLVQQEAAEQRSLLRQQNQINALLREENELKSKTRGGNVEAIGAGPVLNNEVQVPVKPIVKPEQVHEFKEHWVTELGGGLTIAIAIDPASVEKIRDITNEVTSLVEDMASGIGESIGEMMGALVSGEDPWGAFANAALSAFGDMAVSVGKMAIATGTATLGIKAALESLNGYVAIAAGVALVALGTAVKSGLASVASGNYSASANVATTNSASSYTSDYESREVTVNVTGTLEADGDQLVAVINNANKKAYYGS